MSLSPVFSDSPCQVLQQFPVPAAAPLFAEPQWSPIKPSTCFDTGTEVARWTPVPTALWSCESWRGQLETGRAVLPAAARGSQVRNGLTTIPLFLQHLSILILSWFGDEWRGPQDSPDGGQPGWRLELWEEGKDTPEPVCGSCPAPSLAETQAKEMAGCRKDLVLTLRVTAV